MTSRRCGGSERPLTAVYDVTPASSCPPPGLAVRPTCPIGRTVLSGRVSPSASDLPQVVSGHRGGDHVFRPGQGSPCSSVSRAKRATIGGSDIYVTERPHHTYL